jgi:hypothetical protein
MNVPVTLDRDETMQNGKGKLKRKNEYLAWHT